GGRPHCVAHVLVWRAVAERPTAAVRDGSDDRRWSRPVVSATALPCPSRRDLPPQPRPARQRGRFPLERARNLAERVAGPAGADKERRDADRAGIAARVPSRGAGGVRGTLLATAARIRFVRLRPESVDPAN